MAEVKAKPKQNSPKRKNPIAKEVYVKPLYNGLMMDLEEFYSWEPEQLDGWKYEWVNGEIQTNEQKMDKKQWYIQQNIERAFVNTNYWKNAGALLAEAYCSFELGMIDRRPDLAYFSKSQIEDAKNNNNPIPSFIIEIVSTFDQTNSYEQKLREYFAEGVQCVWLVYPIFKEVKVYTSIRQCVICLEQDICSAAPALPDFEISTDRIFE